MNKKSKTKSNKSKDKAWFISLRGSYLPNNAAGWLTYIPYITYLVLTVVIAIQETSSYGLAVLFIVPNLVAATVIMTFIASKKS
jgi:hypothetical protein